MLKTSVQLTAVAGLLPESPAASSPPAFHLTVDVRGVLQGYRSCKGGGNSMLRASYHGIVLAWDRVPWFCIDGGHRSVATVHATAEAAVLREEVRGLIRSEQHVEGSTEFDVEGDVAGLGYLRCKASPLHGKPKGGPCLY